MSYVFGILVTPGVLQSAYQVSSDKGKEKNYERQVTLDILTTEAPQSI